MREGGGQSLAEYSLGMSMTLPFYPGPMSFRGSNDSILISRLPFCLLAMGLLVLAAELLRPSRTTRERI